MAVGGLAAGIDPGPAGDRCSLTASLLHRVASVGQARSGMQITIAHDRLFITVPALNMPATERSEAAVLTVQECTVFVRPRENNGIFAANITRLGAAWTLPRIALRNGG
jgi:hypothetical protein